MKNNKSNIKIINKIKNARNKINLIIFFEKYLNNCLISGLLFSTLFIAGRYFFKSSFLSFFNLVIIIIVTAFIILLKDRKKFFDTKRTAFYIDKQFKFNNILSASLYCIKNKIPGIISKKIIEESRNLKKIKIFAITNPAKILKKTTVTVSLFLAVYLIFFHFNYAFLKENGFKYLISNKELSAGKTSVKSPEIIAKMLAKNDIKLQKEIEKAILKNDIEALKKAIEKSENNFSKELAKAKANKKSQLQNEMLLRNDLIDYLFNEYQKDLKNYQSLRENEILRKDFLEKDKNAASDQEKINNNEPKNLFEKLLSAINKNTEKKSTDGKKTKTSDNDNTFEDEEGDADSDAGEGIGKGSGNNTLKRIVPDKKIESKLFLTPNKDDRFTEKILTDKNPEMLKKDFILNQEEFEKKQKEKNPLPAVYENIIRNYFFEINKTNKKENENEQRNQ